MNKIKMGIIGLGVMGNRMIQAITRFNLNEQLEVTAVCDVNEEVARDFANEHGIHSWTTDYMQLIDNAEIDLVYVAAPPAYHHEIILKAIAADKHVLCEKPLANSIEEAAEMLAAAESSGRVHAMNFPLNYGLAINKFEQLIKEGYIGTLRRINLDMHFPQWPRAWQQNAWISSRKQGGFILEVGVHWIQAIQKVFGPISDVRSNVQFSSNPEECERSITATMNLADGTPITIDGISHIAGNERIALVAYGTEGTIAIENWGELYAGKVNQPLEHISLDEEPARASLLENVVRAIHGKPAEIYDFRVGYDAQVILEALRHP